jgi:hypothetical protein
MVATFNKTLNYFKQPSAAMDVHKHIIRSKCTLHSFEHQYKNFFIDEF